MALPYGEVCKQGPRAAHDSGPRRSRDIKWAVIHTAEAADLSGADNTAENVAAFFANPATQASTQLAVDRDSCVRMLPDLVIPWGASGANTNGVHVEICGRAAWTREQWLAAQLRPMLERTAFKVAMWCYHYEIPVAWVSPDGLKVGRKGLTTHKAVNDAFGKGSHWDPGPGFPGDTFLTMVKKHLAAIKASRRV